MKSTGAVRCAAVFSAAGLAASADIGGSLRRARNTSASLSADRPDVNDALTATVYGKSRCPCVGIDNLEGYYATNIDYYHVQYPIEAGSSCYPWDLASHPDCRDGGGPKWCRQRWCYVDPCNCEIEELPRMTKTGVEYQGSPAYWSYETCGFLDLYSELMSPEACVVQKTQAACAKHSKCAWDGKRCGGKRAVDTCDKAAQLDESVYGQEDCRCVGLAGREPGAAFMYIDDETRVKYPSDVGATCKAWEADVHPECLKGGHTPEWCSTQWCFVDPCKCKTAAPPKMVMKANAHLQFQGKTAFWSAETCGNEDQWAKSHKGEYCVTQKTEADCRAQRTKIGRRRCKWDGNECLGKALVDICKKQKKSGILGFDDLYSGSPRIQTIAASLLLLRALLTV